MNITPEVKSFIEDNIDLIDSKNYDELYQKAYMVRIVPALSSVLWSSGITDILYHMKKVPNNFMDYNFEKNLVDSIEIPETISSIEPNAFWGNDSLKKVHITKNVKRIKHSAFYGCSNLQDIILEEGIETLDYSVFDICTSLERIIIPDTVTYIGNGCFADAEQLKEIILGKNVETIGLSCFSNTAIKTITLPPTLKELGIDAFKFCSDLKEIKLPLTLKNSRINTSIEHFYPNVNIIFY